MFMRELSGIEIKNINGGWAAFAFAALRLGFAIYKHSRRANAATWAARGAGIAGSTYQGMKAVDPYKN